MKGLTILAAFFVVYTLAASRLERWSITAPIVFMTAGLVLGPSVLNVLPFRVGDEVSLTLTELTLALVLFADASTVRLREVEGDVQLPGRLLLLGLPLTIALGTLVAGVMFNAEGWAAAAVIATILAPTDAALGLAVFTDPAVPVRIRRALNVESGLNDGLATPFLALFLALLASEEGVGAGWWLLKASEQIALAFGAALVVGVLDVRTGRGRLLSLVPEARPFDPVRARGRLCCVSTRDPASVWLPDATRSKERMSRDGGRDAGGLRSLGGDLVGGSRPRTRGSGSRTPA